MMASQTLPCSFPLPYGCWCGPTSPFPAPHPPVDAFDAACRDHDYCYADAEAGEGQCGFLDEFVWLYQWDNVNGEVRIFLCRNMLYS